MHRNQEDQELITRCLEKDEEAWSTLSNLVERLVGGLSAAWRLDAQTQQDVVQEVLAALLHNECQALKQFEYRSRLSTYLGRIVLQVAGDLLPNPPPAIIEPNKIPDPIEILIEEESRDAFWQTVQHTLSPIDVQILRLSVLGYTLEAIAQRLSRLHNTPWRGATVRQRKSRAIRKLQALLSRTRKTS